MIINMSGGGSPGKIVTVHVTPGTGASVTCTNGKKTFTGTTDANGDAVFKLSKGTWTITAENSGASFSQNVTVAEDCTVNISLEQIPAFTYTGNYEIVNDNDTVITTTFGNWKIRFLTSGTLTFTALNGARNGIDVFLVGGGGGGNSPSKDASYSSGGGGGGGYTSTITAIQVDIGTQYTITVGAGGAANNNGGNTSCFGATSKGGYGSRSDKGGDGGSGGGSGAGAGGTDGSNGGSDGDVAGGTGQHTTTREFGDSSGKLYSSGGSGGSFSPSNAAANTGNGGIGKYWTVGGGQAGGSGIVIIRNAREVA